LLLEKQVLLFKLVVTLLELFNLAMKMPNKGDKFIDDVLKLFSIVW
jgi:hypothetical protein